MKRTLLISSLVLFFVAQSLSGFAIAVSSEARPEESTATAVTPAVPSMQSISEVMAEFKNLSKQERKDRLKEVKKEIKQYKAEQKNNAAPSTNTLLLVILALLLPPLAVYLHQGEINGKFWLSLLLTLLFIVPGIIYALIVVLGEA